MNRSILFLFLTLLYAVSGAAADRVRATIEFGHAAPVAVVEQLGLEDVTITSMTYRWGDQKAIYLTDPQDSIETMAAKFARRLEGILGIDVPNAEMQLTELRSRGMGISAVEIEGMPDVVAKTIRSVERSGHAFLMAPRELRLQGTPEPQVFAVGGEPYPNAPWRFSPSTGSITHNPSNRTITSSFKWTDVSGFDSTHRGYEHDIVVKDLPGFSLGPDSIFWSDLPAWYVDDPSYDFHPPLTIGTDAATQIQANRYYNVRVGYNLSTVNSGQTGRLDVQPQLGSWAGTYDEGDGNPTELGEWTYCNVIGRWPKTARSCIFADQTNRILKFYENTAATSPIYVYAPFVVGQARTFYWNKDITLASKNCGSSYKAEYFKGTAFDLNNMMFVRCEDALSQNWGYSGPENDMTENFSVRWSRQVPYAEGRYRFTALHDDGMRVTIGGVQRLNEWYDQASRTSTFDVDLWGGTYTVVAEYYERTGTAGASLVSKLQTPAVPSWLSAAYVSNQVRLTWPDTFSETSYVFEMRPANGSWSQAGTVSANNTSWTVPLSFVPGQTYFFRMRAMNAAGYSPYGSETSVTIPGNSGPATVLYESAEAGAPGWTVGSGWMIQTSNASPMGSRRFLLGNGSAYWNSMDARLTSPAFSLVNRSSMRVSFAYKYDIEAGWDFFWLELSPDNGVTWMTVTPKWSGKYPAGTDWARADYTFHAPYAGKSAVRLRFRFTSDKDVVKWGAAVDDIRVTAQ